MLFQVKTAIFISVLLIRFTDDRWQIYRFTDDRFTDHRWQICHIFKKNTIFGINDHPFGELIPKPEISERDLSFGMGFKGKML